MTSIKPSTRPQGHLTEKILNFCIVLQRLVVEAKKYDTLPADFWGPLQEFVDVDAYRRCSQDYPSIVQAGERQEGYDSAAFQTDMLNWEQWTKVAGDWALSPSLWEYTVMRIAEFTIPNLPGVVYLELEERGGFSGQASDIHWSNTILLFEFNSDDRLTIMRLGVADYALRAWPVSHPSSSLVAAD